MNRPIERRRRAVVDIMEYDHRIINLGLYKGYNVFEYDKLTTLRRRLANAIRSVVHDIVGFVD